MSETWPITPVLALVAAVCWPLILNDIFDSTKRTPRTAVYFAAATTPSEFATVTLRCAVTLSARVRLHLLTTQIGARNRMNADDLTEAMHDHRVYIELLLSEPNGHDAPEFYNYILDKYDVEVVKLARCYSLIRHGIFRGELISSEYDVARQLCVEINGGPRFAPFFSRIRRGNKQWSQKRTASHDSP